MTDQVLTLGTLIRYMLPEGTAPWARASARDVPDEWFNCPIWPPDLFGVVASIAAQTGCYAEPGIVLSRNARERKLKRAWATQTRKLGAEWRETTEVPARVELLWSRFRHFWLEPLISEPASPRARIWKRLVAHLFAVADEACSNLGFLPLDGYTFALLAFEELRTLETGALAELVLRLPHSFAAAIPPDRMCIMPKSLTPGVGCTLRSLSHNLAMLPGIGAVRPRWFIAADPASESDDETNPATEFNLLVVPYPYEVSRLDFEPSRPPESGIDGYFTLRQGWLGSSDSPVRRDMISDFIVALVHEAEVRLGDGNGPGTVHAVVLPETALSTPLADALAEDLAKALPQLELLVTGELSRQGRYSRNQAVLARLGHGGLNRRVVQGKHHRWRLDRTQIQQYQLSRALDPERRWWEDIDVSAREIAFGLVRDDIVVCALVCEDLARFDPVLPVINAVGPNLVLALLMDGPQLQSRWPGRYATVLAEDPGSSVLTVTSLGMVRLARRHGEPDNRVIGLWKDAHNSGAKELYLPHGSHGLLLSLKNRSIEQTTIDLRDDASAARVLTLDEVWPVALAAPPDWLAKP